MFTISASYTVVASDNESLQDFLASIEGNQKLSNLVVDEENLTATFGFYEEA